MASDSTQNITEYDLVAKRARDRQRRERVLTSDAVYRSDFQETRYASNDDEMIIKTYSTRTAAHLVNFGETVELRVIEDLKTEETETIAAAEVVKEQRYSAKSMRSNSSNDQKYKSRTRDTTGDELAGKSRDSVRFNSQKNEERTKSGSRSCRSNGRPKSTPETAAEWKLKSRAGKSSDHLQKKKK